jgi:ABC-type multidrug transport system ATPase subunit
MENVMLQLEHVKKSYDKKEVLTDVTYTFEEGKVYSLLGGAGAGRTTLLECICGDLSIDVIGGFALMAVMYVFIYVIDYKKIIKR